jgi:hypothetical protein
MGLQAANREVDLLLKEGIEVSVPDPGDSSPGKGTPHPACGHAIASMLSARRLEHGRGGVREIAVF